MVDQGRRCRVAVASRRVSSPAGSAVASATAWPDHSDVKAVSPSGSAAPRSGSTAPVGPREAGRGGGQRADLAHEAGHDAAGRATGEHVGERRLLRGRAAQRGPVELADRGLRAQEVGGADLDAAGTEHERGGDPPVVGDAAGCDHGHVDGVDDLRDERHRADLGRHVAAQEGPTVPAGLGPLGDDGVAAVVRQPAGLGHRRGRGDHPRPAGPDPFEQIVGRQPEVEADDLRTERFDDLASSIVERDDRHVVRVGLLQTELGVVRRQELSPAGLGAAVDGVVVVAEEVQVDGPRRQRPERFVLGVDGVGVEERARQRSEAAGLADRAGQRRALCASHRRLHDRHVDAGELEEPAVRPSCPHAATLRRRRRRSRARCRSRPHPTC